MKNERFFFFFFFFIFFFFFVKFFEWNDENIFGVFWIDVGKMVGAPHLPPSKEGERKGEWMGKVFWIRKKFFLSEEKGMEMKCSRPSSPKEARPQRVHRWTLRSHHEEKGGKNPHKKAHGTGVEKGANECTPFHSRARTVTGLKTLKKRFWKNRKKPPETAKQRPDEEIPLGGDHYREKPSSYSGLKINLPQKRPISRNGPHSSVKLARQLLRPSPLA